MSFSELGNSKAERDIEANELQNNPTNFEIKPFTTKVSSHLLEALDLASYSMDISRNALVTKLIEQFLGQAFFEFHAAYKANFSITDSEEKYVVSRLEALSNVSNISPEAVSYLSGLVVDFIQEN